MTLEVAQALGTKDAKSSFFPRLFSDSQGPSLVCWDRIPLVVPLFSGKLGHQPKGWEKCQHAPQAKAGKLVSVEDVANEHWKCLVKKLSASDLRCTDRLGSVTYTT